MEYSRLLPAHMRRSRILRQRLLDLDAVLCRTRDGGYSQCLDTLTALHDLCRFLIYEGQDAFEEEETHFYPILEGRQPQLRGLLADLRWEHDALREAIEEFSQALAHFNSTGNLHQLPRVGRKLASLFRRHLDREE
ncbi:MAG: hemerythrin domain-containing protein, partial [Acidobacteria bacterium]|nr:hemerythrin domain-containing protein [Acidobacteriota bacterium]